MFYVIQLAYDPTADRYLWGAAYTGAKEAGARAAYGRVEVDGGRIAGKALMRRDRAGAAVLHTAGVEQPQGVEGLGWLLHEPGVAEAVAARGEAEGG